MSETLDIQPSKGPLSFEYRQWVLSIAKDVVALNKYRPFLEMALRDTMGGAETGGSVFPAMVQSESGGGAPHRHGEPCSYIFRELASPFDHTSFLNIEGGRGGLCTNTMEYRLTQQRNFGDPLYIPPGIDEGCLNLVDDEGPRSIEEEISIDVRQIADNTIVPMHEVIATVDIELGGCGTIAAGQPYYFFSVPVPFCVRCVTDDESPPGPGIPFTEEGTTQEVKSDSDPMKSSGRYSK